MILALAVICAAGYVAVDMSGGSEQFMTNYIYNVKKNIQALGDKMGINLPRENTEAQEKENAEATALPTDGPTDEPDAVAEDEAESAKKSGIQADSYNTVAMADADLMQYAPYKDYLVCADNMSLMAFDKKGNSAWAVAMSTKKPILKVGGNYILLAEKGGNNVRLFVDSKMIYSAQTENEIIGASVSEGGDVVVITDKPQYKGSVIVYNKEGEEVFVWNSGSYDILDADIAPSSRNVAVALLDTKSGVKSHVSFFNINEKEPYLTPEFDDTLIFDVEFSGESLNAVGDNKLIGMNNKGKEKWSVDFGSKKLAKYAISPDGDKLVMFDNSSAAQIQLLDKNGKEKMTVKSEAIPDCVDISSSRIAYNSGRELLFGEYSGKIFKNWKTDRDIKNIIILDGNTVVLVYSGSIEFCEF